MYYNSSKRGEENARKGEELFHQGRYEEAVAYLRRAAYSYLISHRSYAYLAYCHYKGYGTPVNHYAAYRWCRLLLEKRQGVDIAKSIWGNDFDKIYSLRVSAPQSDCYEFNDYIIGRVVVRSGTRRERTQFYSNRVEVEVSSQYNHYDSHIVIGMIYNLFHWHEDNRNLPPHIDENYRENYDLYSLLIKRGACDKITHRVSGNCYTIIVPYNTRFEQIVTREAIIIESNKIMKKAALSYLPQRLKELSERTGLKYTLCHIRKIEGNCSGMYTKSGEIFLIPEIIKDSSLEIDAILIHELCHSLVLGHGQDFYDMVLKYGGEEILKINQTFTEYKLQNHKTEIPYD